MPAYIPITDSQTDPDKPLTSELAKQWRDNPVAIAEGDPSVPEELRHTPLFGSVPTPSGTTYTLSGLDLTLLRGLRIVWGGVSINSGGIGTQSVTIGFVTVTGVNPGDLLSGIITYDLASGVCSGNLLGASGVVLPVAGIVPITNATTAITASVAGGSSFDGGGFTVYGLK